MGTHVDVGADAGQTTVNRLHPELLRRFDALIDAASQARGSVRGRHRLAGATEPATRRVRQAGQQLARDRCRSTRRATTALAIDTVPNISWEWMHANCGAYGLRHFKYVNNEPWHVQPVGDLRRSRKFATELPPLATWELPSTPPR